MKSLYLVEATGLNIYRQLELEESLFRCDHRDWCVINRGSPPAIVMGRFGTPGELVDLTCAAENKIPVIRRFSGGGTVVVDENTFFLSFILNKSFLTSLNLTSLPSKETTPLTPEEVIQWHLRCVQHALMPLEVTLRAQDLCLGMRKFVGQAQAFSRDRFVHHSTFLVDYCPRRMECLKLPSKAPSYRHGRPHSDFITSLRAEGWDHERLRHSFLKFFHEKWQLIPVSMDQALRYLESYNDSESVETSRSEVTLGLLSRSGAEGSYRKSYRRETRYIL